MKKILFIENDNEKKGMEDFQHVLINLEVYGNLTDENTKAVENCEKLFNFFHLEPEQKKNLLYGIMDEKKIVVSFSMYTENHFNSLFSLYEMLKTVGRNHVSGLTYISTSGYLKKALENLINNVCRTSDDLQHLVGAINRNQLISCSHNGLVRLKATFSDEYDAISEEPLENLNHIFVDN